MEVLSSKLFCIVYRLNRGVSKNIKKASKEGRKRGRKEGTIKIEVFFHPTPGVYYFVMAEITLFRNA